jgi:hypothetical protein
MSEISKKSEDPDGWIEITRENIIEKFNLSKIETLLIIKKFNYECIEEESYVKIHFPFYSMFNDDNQDIEDIIDSEIKKLLDENSITDKESIENFLIEFYQTISNIEKIQIINEWYTNGMYPDIIQNEEGIEVDEYCDQLIFETYKSINQIKNPKNK